MRLWILTKTEATASTVRLDQAARDAGHDVERIAFEQVTVRHAYPGARLAGAPDPWPDLVLNRLEGDETHLRHGTRVQAALETGGVIGLNSSAAVAVAAVKSSVAQRLAAAGLPQPPTVVSTVDSDPQATLDVTGVPVVLKPDRGRGAGGVQRIDDAGHMAQVLAGMADRGVRELVAQPYLPDAATTIRAIVLGGHVVAAVAGHASEDRWQASLDVAERVDAAVLPPREQALAVAAAAACGLHVAGVDLVRVRGGEGSSYGPDASGSTVVLDVTPAPELMQTGDAAGIDLVSETLSFLAWVQQRGSLPDVGVPVRA